MLTKENIISVINNLEEPISFDDVIDRLLLLEKIEIGLQQSREGKVISDEEMETRMKEWFKN